MLAHYVSAGVGRAGWYKLGPLLKLKYNNAIADAFADLGTPDTVRSTFVGFSVTSTKAEVDCGEIQIRSNLLNLFSIFVCYIAQ